MKIGVLRETATGERRVALAPETAAKLAKAGLEVVVESGAGAGAYFPDEAYRQAGATVEADPEAVLSRSDLLVKVQKPSPPEARRLREGSAVVAFIPPAASKDLIGLLAERKVSAFSMDRIPRITRAQTMDALSSQSTVAGYKAVVLAADSLGKLFPLLMTAAGTLAPAKVFVLGAGVAGLQAIATARRLGAVVTAFDVRPAVKEQVESLGAKFLAVEMEAGMEDRGGYAKQLSEEAHRREEELLHRAVKEMDIVITTALVPGKPAPRLIREATVREMRPGSVIVDLAAETGGNCELTRAGEVVERHGVTIHGPLNLPSTVPLHASLMYSRNVASFLGLLLKDGALRIDLADEILAATCLTHAGEIRTG